MIHYFIEVSIAWALFYAIYFIFLKRETFFNINRWYLLHTIWIGAVIPFVRKIPISLESVEPMIMQPVQLIHYSTYAFSEAMAVPIEESMFNYQYLVYGLYFLGLMFFSVKFFHGLKNIWKLWRSGEKVIHDDFTMVLSDDYHLPFSFLKFVFLHRSFLEDDAISEIIDHEMIHVKSRHTFDVLFFEIVSILFWWNPIIYFYKKEIRQTHEYVADAYASQSTHIKNYGQILLGQSSSGIELALSNQFFNSYLKKRINMLYKKKSAHYKLSKYLLVIPILFFLCVLYSFKNNSEGTEYIFNINSEINEVLSDINFKVTAKSNYEGSELTEIEEPQLMHFISEYEDSTVDNNEGNIIHNVALELSSGISNKVNESCEMIKGTDIYFKSDVRPILKQCKSYKAYQDQCDCTSEKMKELLYSNIEYTDAAIEEGYQCFYSWSLVIGVDGKIIEVKQGYPKKKSNVSFGMKERFDEVLEMLQRELVFEPAMCNNKEVKGISHLSYLMKLNNEQKSMIKIKDSNNTKNILQQLSIIAMNYDGTLSYRVESNLNTPTTIKIIDPEGNIISEEELPYFYKRINEAVKVPNPVNGTYFAVMTQDGKEVKSSIPVSIF